MAASPSLFLAAAASRTKRIRLGPLVYLLPLYEPLRLAEEICMLDQLSNGRLEVGVGRGVSPYELGCFGVDPATTRPIFDETRWDGPTVRCTDEIHGDVAVDPASLGDFVVGAARSCRATSSRLRSTTPRRA
jgi:hypothetical protein